MFQPQQGFGDWQKAHPQFDGQLTARNDLTDGQFSAEDALAYDHIRFTR
jgi:hypothetical protein